MELFLDHKPIPEDLLRNAIRKSTLSLNYLPVIMGSSFKNKAVQNLLDAIVDYLPSPNDKDKITGHSPKSNKLIERKLNDDEPFSALIFKIVSDLHVGQLVYFRVYSGFIKSGDTIFNSNKGKKCRISKLLKMHSNKREEVNKLYSGDIAAAIGLNDVSTGDTLCDERNHILLESINFPDPVISTTIEPRLTSEHKRLAEILVKLSAEDPTFKTKVDPDTGQTIISGMGELHLEIISERIKREFGLEIKMGKPRVAYQETIKNEVVGEEKYDKQTGGKGQYGHVVLRLSPYKGEDKFKFNIKIKSNVIPKEFFKAIENGIKEAMDFGVLAGYPVTNVEVTLMDGSFHEEDSTELAFKVAASRAFSKAFKDGNPILLEPMMKIEIVVPDDYLGEVIGDFNSREGKVINMTMNNNLHVVDGFVPLSNMFGYATIIRTLSQGRANYSMEFHDYIKMTKKKMMAVLRNQLGIVNFN